MTIGTKKTKIWRSNIISTGNYTSRPQVNS